jgi:all-trans-8'-apo-beta-carotenal 15,15'-oxygenase
MISLTIPLDGIAESDLQFINAYEEDDQTIILDAIRMDISTMTCQASSYPWASTLEDFCALTSKRELVRYTVNLQSQVILKNVLLDSQCYFGTINPLVSSTKHRYVYSTMGTLGAKVAPPQGILKLDVTAQEVTSWIPQSYEFCSEPIFASSTNQELREEDDGYILSTLWNGKTTESELIILSAKKMSLLARIPLGIAVPHGLHGFFSVGDKFTADEIDRRVKLAEKMESRGNMWNEVKSDFSGLGLRLDDLEEYFGDIM